MNTMNIKNILLIFLMRVGGFISYLLGGWDELLKGLCTCMLLDLASGLILTFVFHKCPKTQNGCTRSKEIFKGLAKKICMLFLVVVCVCIDHMINKNYIRKITIIILFSREGLSILSKLDQMGVSYPECVKKLLKELILYSYLGYF